MICMFAGMRAHTNTHLQMYTCIPWKNTRKQLKRLGEREWSRLLHGYPTGTSPWNSTSCVIVWQIILPIVNTAINSYPPNGAFTHHPRSNILSWIITYFSFWFLSLSPSLSFSLTWLVSIYLFIYRCQRTHHNKTWHKSYIFNSYHFTHDNEPHFHHQTDHLWISDECLLWGNGGAWNALNWQHGHHYVM